MSVSGGVLSGTDLVGAAAEDLRAGVTVGRIAARFHHGLADATVRAVASTARRARDRDGGASGGVFVNEVLLERVRAGLEAAGLEVLVPSRVPCNDGGISSGSGRGGRGARRPRSRMTRVPETDPRQPTPRTRGGVRPPPRGHGRASPTTPSGSRTPAARWRAASTPAGGC